MKCTLVIPCYNESKSLPDLISKCSNLTKADPFVDVLLVNNGSTDNTKDILKKLSSKTNRINYIDIKVNKGYGNGIIEGLKNASGEILSWTHADLQTDPNDIIPCLKIFRKESLPKKLLVKGKRAGRPISDTFFTLGMSIFETILFKRVLWDINAQPNLIHRSFFETWNNPPKDFSLDLYCYYLAKKNNFKVKKVITKFSKRTHGTSSWNTSFKNKINFIKRTLKFSLELKRH